MPRCRYTQYNYIEYISHLALLLALFAAGCTDSYEPAGTNCTVTCPAGSICKGDQCLPVCQPACQPNEYCGADSRCHQGPAPDSGITVPPVDGGVKPNKDSQVKQDKGNPNQALCDCLNKQPKQAYCYKQKDTCTQPSDCCMPGSSIPCGTYGNHYVCDKGKCRPKGCTNKNECANYAKLIKQPDAADWVCHPPLCPFMRSYCAAKIKSCTKPADCCSKTSKSPCGVYPNHWTCDKGKCAYTGCQGNSECVTYAQSAGLPNPGSYSCLKNASSCYNQGYCSLPGKSCTKPADCCVTASTIPCGTYGNRYRCESNLCIFDYCKSKQDCLNYATALKIPDPSQYNCIGL